jgi:hypothetical protein
MYVCPIFLIKRVPTDHRSKRLMEKRRLGTRAVRVNHRGFCQLPARHILVYERWISSFASAHLTMEQTLNELPPLDEARTLIDSYYRYYAWK